jgi:tetratricopeptide (TPR) repeat protein
MKSRIFFIDLVGIPLLSVATLAAPAIHPAAAFAFQGEKAKLQERLERNRKPPDSGAAPAPKKSKPPAAPAAPRKPSRKRTPPESAKAEAKPETPTTPSASDAASPPAAGTAAAPAPVLVATVITTNVSHAEVACGGKKLGETGDDKRLSASLPPGMTEITVTAPGYETVTQAVDLQPNNAQIAFALPINTGALMTRYLSPQHTDSIRLEDWENWFAAQQAKIAEDPTSGAERASWLFAQGQIAFSKKDFAAARASFLEAVKLEPMSQALHYALGKTFLSVNEVQSAQQAFQRAIELSPVMTMAYAGLGEAFERQKKIKDANANYERAATQGYQPYAMRIRMVRNTMREKQWSSAVSLLTSLAKSNPTDEVFILLGDCHQEKDQTADALESYNRARTLNPKSADAHYKAADTLFHMKKYSEARTALEQALSLTAQIGEVDRGAIQKLYEKVVSKLR